MAMVFKRMTQSRAILTRPNPRESEDDQAQQTPVFQTLSRTGQQCSINPRMRSLALLILLLNHLALVCPNPLQGGRPNRPPLIWTWLSDALGADNDKVIKRVDEPENVTYVEELAEAGFNMTGVYVSPDSVLNPLKWAQLLQKILPGPKEVRPG